MNRFFLYLIFTLNSFYIFAQNDIINQKTENHKQIRGTKIFIIPPSGFVEAMEYQGFKKINEYAKIEFNGEKPFPFKMFSSQQKYQSTNPQGVLVKSKKNLKVNGFDGSFVILEMPINGQTVLIYNLDFGDYRSTMTLSGTCIKGNNELEQEIINSLFSICYDSNAKEVPYSPISFTINVDKSKLKFSRTFKGALFYTDDGNFPPQSEDKTNFVVGPNPDIIEPEKQKSFSIEKMKKLPYEKLEINEKNVHEITIDGLPGIEISAIGIRKSDNTKELVYQVTLFSDNGSYTIYGTTKNDFESKLELFKELSRTFARK